VDYLREVFYQKPKISPSNWNQDPTRKKTAESFGIVKERPIRKLIKSINNILKIQNLIVIGLV
jgi:hypothetical protein